MKSSNLVQSLILIGGLTSACSGEAGLKGLSHRLTGDKHSDKSEDSGSGDGSSSSTNGDSESTTATEPAQVSGAFLVDCELAPSLSPDLPTVAAGQVAIGCAVLDQATKLKTTKVVTALKIHITLADGTTRSDDAQPATSPDSAYHGYVVLPAEVWAAVQSYSADVTIDGAPASLAVTPRVSPEAGAAAPPGTAAGPDAPSPAIGLYVDRIFNDVLGHAADDASREAYGKRLQAARAANNNTSYENTLTEIIASPESLKRMATTRITALWGSADLATESEVHRVVYDPNNGGAARHPRDTFAVIAADDKAVAFGGGTAAGWQALLWQTIFGRAPDAGEVANVLPIAVRLDRINAVLDILKKREVYTNEWAGYYHDVLRRPTEIAALRDDADVIKWVDSALQKGFWPYSPRFRAWILMSPEYFTEATTP